MQSFKDYIISEFNVSGTTSILFKFSHSLTEKKDKKTKHTLNYHTITVQVHFYDKDLNLLLKESLKFVNNLLAKKDEQRLVNIAPKELENRFNFARREIVGEIVHDLHEKVNDISDKLTALELYDSGTNNNIIPSEFKGEVIQIAEEKQKFDM